MNSEAVTEKLTAALGTFDEAKEADRVARLYAGADADDLAQGVHGSLVMWTEAVIAALLPVVREIVADELREAADQIDRGPTFPLPPSIISALVRERADALA